MSINHWGYDLDKRTKLLLDIREAMNEVGLRFTLGRGTVLAAYRDHVWIPWDTDIDIEIKAETADARSIREVTDRLSAKKYIVTGTGRAWGVHCDTEVASLQRWHLHGQYRIYREVAAHPARFWENPQKIKFCGEVFFAPHPIEEYLDDMYINWKVPTRKKRGYDVKGYTEKCKARREEPV